MKDINLSKLVKYIFNEFLLFMIFREFPNMGRITPSFLSPNADNWSGGWGNIRKRWTSILEFRVRGDPCQRTFLIPGMGDGEGLHMVLTGTPISHIFIGVKTGDSLRSEFSRRLKRS